MNEVVIDDSQREMCAVLVMRTMLTDYCDDTGVSFNDVWFPFILLISFLLFNSCSM